MSDRSVIEEANLHSLDCGMPRSERCRPAKLTPRHIYDPIYVHIHNSASYNVIVTLVGEDELPVPGSAVTCENITLCL